MLLLTSLMAPFASQAAFAQDAEPAVEPAATSEETGIVSQDQEPIVEPSVADEMVAVPVDTDGDGIEDALDVCAGGNDLVDTDGDGTADTCDATPNGDTDGDGVDNLSDATPNGDTDGDGVDNLIDATPNGDADGDGVDNSADACPAGDDAIDTDGDGTADACDDTPNGVMDEPATEETEPVTDETASVAVDVAAEEQVVASAPVSCAVAEGAAPWIASDLADYPPGALVTLTGAGWVAGQKVEIFVDDDGVADAGMGPWSHATTVTADPGGNIFYQFNLADWYVANYTVVATGECSEATTAFTDGDFNLQVVGVSSAVISWEVFPKSNCEVNRAGDLPLTGSKTIMASAGSVPATSSGSSGSVRFTAPPISGYTVSWSPGGPNVICTNGNGGLQTFTATYVPARANQTISFAALANKSSTDAPFTVSATASSGLPVSFAATGSCTVSGSTVTITGVGDCTVTASQSGSTSFNAAPSVTRTFTIARADQAITFAPIADQTFGGADVALGATASSGLAVSYAAVGDCTIVSGNVRFTGAGDCTVTASQAGNANYNAAPDVSRSFDIAKATATLSLSNLSYTYDGTPRRATVTTDPAGLTGVIVTYDSLAVAPSASGTYAVEATLINDNYAAVSATGTLTILKADQTITFGELDGKTFGDSAFTVSATASSGLDVRFTTTGSCTLDGSTVRIDGAGDCTVTASQAGNANYNAAENVIRSFEIGKAGQTITFGELEDRTFGAGPFDVSATTTSPLAVRFKALGNCTVNGSTVTIHAAGSCTVTASQAGDDDYAAADSVPRTFSIGQAPVTVTVDPASKVYGDDDPRLTYRVSGTVVEGDVFTGSLSRAPGEDVGTYAISLGTLALNGNYRITFAGAALTITAREITVTAITQTKIYGDTDPTLDYTVDGTLVGTDAFTGALTRAAGEHVGPYAITQGTVAINGNYDVTFVGATLTITAREITVTADALTKTFGGDDPTLSYKVGGTVVEGDAFTGSLTRVSGEDVGDYAVTRGTLTLNGNYAITFVSAAFTITPATLVVTAEDSGKVYGDEDPALTYDFGAGVRGDEFTGSLTRDGGQDVGSYAITQGSLLLTNANYTLAFTAATFEITARKITVTAIAQTKIYGGEEPTLIYGFEGTLVEGDTFSGSLSRTSGENIGTYPISVGDVALSDNYAITFVAADLTITARPITVTADGKTRTFGAADPALTYTVTSGSLVGTDAFTGALSRTAGSDVGTYDILQDTLSLSGNYSLTFVGATLTITQAGQTIDFAALVDKTFGDAAFTVSATASSGIAVGLMVTGECTIDGNTVTITGEGDCTVTASQAGNGNFSAADDVAQTFTIAARTITVTANAQTKVYGTATDPDLTYRITSGTLVGSDTFTGSLTRVAGENLGTYAIGVGTLALSANYDLTFAGADLAITARPVTVTAIAQTKVFGTADPVLAYTVTGGSLMDGDAFTGSLTRAAGTTVGTYAITQGTLALGTNYVLTFVGANLTITSVPLTIRGPYQPIDLGGVVNTTKGGSTVPIKFEVFQGTTEITDVRAVSIQIREYTCGAALTGNEAVIEQTATGGTSLRYDPTGGQFIYNWQTPRKPGTCYTVTISASLPDSGVAPVTSPTAYIRLK